MANSKGFTLSGVGIFITYLICMWMLAMVASTQKMQKKMLEDQERLIQAIVQKRAIVIDSGVSPEVAETIISNIVSECTAPKEVHNE